MIKLVIVQPYVPRYRVPFFDALVDRLENSGITAVVAAAAPSGEQRSRSDEATGNLWQRRLSGRRLHLGHHQVDLSTALELYRDADAAVMPLQATLVDTHLATAWRRLSNERRLGLWGHVAAFVRKGNRLDQWIERQQMLRADHVFAYTAEGAAHATTAGIPPGKVTTVNNSVDTTRLQGFLSSAAPTREQLVERYGLGPGPVFSYIGGLDKVKGVHFLAAALDTLWRLDSNIQVVVAGHGADEEVLQAAERRGQVRRLGFIGDQEKAELGRLSEALLMPGRIGLVAVEALAMGLPIIAAPFAWDAPEAGYLVEGESLFRCPGDEQGYARFISTFRRQPVEPRGWWYPTLDDMVSNFHTGVLRMLEPAV